MPSLNPIRLGARQNDLRSRAGHFRFWILDFGLAEGVVGSSFHPRAQFKIQNPKSKISPRRGLTLIEMLMATAITLLMMAAVVTLFANLSGSISNRRALIELSGQLRQVRQRLARDLAGCTVPPGPQGLTPWRARPGEAIGYFEILEGDRSDARPSRLVDGQLGNGEIDYTTSQIPSGGDPQTLLTIQRGSDRDGDPSLREGDVTNGGALGDADDILAMTVRSLDDPFVAIVDVPVDYDGDGIVDENGNFVIDGDESEEQRVESNLAEVIWYSIETPLDDPGTEDDERVIAGVRGEPGMRTVYRRVRLIAPWLPSSLNNYDGKISTHRELRNPDDVTMGEIHVPNTLADLTRREFRWAHEYIINDLTRPDLDFPHEFDLFDVPPAILTSREFAVLDNVLAFDVRVLDPGAPVYAVAGSDTTIDPVDPAWQSMVGATPVSYGAYVDLGWNNAGTYDFTAFAGAPPTVFQQEHRLGWHPRNPGAFRGTPATYDTWTWHYENDGRDQDGDFVLNSLGATVDLDGDGFPDPLVDEGTNGRDDLNPDGSLGINGVDDVLERETSPPYPYPLRAVKVVLRVYERDARQIREASVINSFVP